MQWKKQLFTKILIILDVFKNVYFFQEILALTGGGKTREYTETRPDGSTVTYTIDVEEEIIEVSEATKQEVDAKLSMLTAMI